MREGQLHTAAGANTTRLTRDECFMHHGALRSADAPLLIVKDGGATKE